MTSSASQTIPLIFDTIREVAFGSITGSFAAVGGAITKPARLIKFLNATNTDLDVSLDGTHIQDRLPPNSFALYDMSANHGAPGYSALQEQISVYVRQKSGSAAPASGYFAVIVVFGKF